MDPSPLHPSLLRPPLLHILRAAGFTTTRPSVLDTLTDLTSRHLQLLAQHSLRHALLREPTSLAHPYPAITLPDVRMAMQDVGVLYPSTGEMEEEVKGGEEDLRGVEGFVNWCTGEGNREIRRIAGMTTPSPSLPTTTAPSNTKLPTDPTAPAAAAADPTDTPNPDYLAQLKRKHAKTKDGEEARYAGTVLGRDREGAEIRIEGWSEVGSIEEWRTRLELKGRNGGVEVREMEVGEGEGGNEDGGEGSRSGSSSPLSEISGEEVEEVVKEEGG
ncbi:hypothetical protein ACLMJK_002731 [Lecanora helva]